MAAEATKRPFSIGAILLGLLVFILLFGAAYLWLTDGGSQTLSLGAPKPPVVMPASPPTPVAAKLLPLPKAGPAAVKPAPTSASPPEPNAEPEPARPAGPVDPQVAADAAATGMTSRVRPVEPGTLP
jgi:hypothetical protein